MEVDEVQRGVVEIEEVDEVEKGSWR